jgi:PhnB protein
MRLSLVRRLSRRKWVSRHVRLGESVMSTYPTIVPYLAVSDAAAALEFYKQAFGAKETMRVPGQDRGIMHAEVLVNGGLIMLTDSTPEMGFPAPKPGDQVPVGIMVQWDKPADVDAMFAQAVAAGGTAETAPRDEPWGARFAGIVDPFGQRWWLHAPLPGTTAKA